MNAVTEIEPVREDVTETMRRAKSIGLPLLQKEAEVIVAFEERANAAFGGMEAANLTNKLLDGLRDSLWAAPTFVAGGVEKPYSREKIFDGFMSSALIMVRQGDAKACRNMIAANTGVFTSKSPATALVPQ